MTTLAPCHSRLELPSIDDRFVCLHPQVFATGNVVPYEFCRLCDYWRQPAPTEPRRLPPHFAERLLAPCRHLGQETGLRECPSCLGRVRLKVFACSHPRHVETTLSECEHCDDFCRSHASEEGPAEGVDSTPSPQFPAPNC